MRPGDCTSFLFLCLCFSGSCSAVVVICIALLRSSQLPVAGGSCWCMIHGSVHSDRALPYFFSLSWKAHASNLLGPPVRSVS